MSFRYVTNCRACSSDKLIRVLDLGIQPLANSFRKQGDSNPGQYPLAVDFCPRCSLAQLSVVVDPKILYANYPYVTSPSAMMRDHFKALLADISTEQKPGPLVEIGSNDGLFLAFMSDNGYGNVIGIDPATNLAQQSCGRGITTINDFFGISSATLAKGAAGQVDLVVARHVFCHIDDWDRFVEALDALASKETLICIEVPDIRSQLKSLSFDQCYHEHLSYLSLNAMKHLLMGSQFHLHRVCHYPIHGGSKLIMIRRNDSSIPPHPSVWDILGMENITLKDWQKFADDSELLIMQLRQVILELAVKGKRICGYGASAKSTVWINSMGLTRKEIYGVYDGTSEKQYCTVPGTDIPVLHEGAFYADDPHYAVNFAWNYTAEILAKHEKWLKGGGHFIVPVPTLRVIGIDEAAQKA